MAFLCKKNLVCVLDPLHQFAFSGNGFQPVILVLLENAVLSIFRDFLSTFGEKQVGPWVGGGS